MRNIYILLLIALACFSHHSVAQSGGVGKGEAKKYTGTCYLDINGNKIYREEISVAHQYQTTIKGAMRTISEIDDQGKKVVLDKNIYIFDGIPENAEDFIQCIRHIEGAKINAQLDIRMKDFSLAKKSVLAVIVYPEGNGRLFSFSRKYEW